MDQEKSKNDVVDDVEYTYSSEWIYTLEDEGHWLHYWQQQNLMQGYIQSEDTILEIGVGTSFTANYLKSKKMYVTTMDIDKEKKPDIVGNIVIHDWNDVQYNHILGFEVFEHIPFKEFSKILSKLRKVAKKNIFISLPLNEKVLMEVDYKLPKFRKRNFRIPIAKNKITTKNHFWEVGFKEYTELSIEEIFKGNNLIVLKKIKKNGLIYYALGHDD